MLPTHFEPNLYHFIVQNVPPRRVLLVSDDLALKARTVQTEPFWYLEVGDERSMEAVLRWLRVRRAQWNGWGRLAETAGRPALADHMAKLMKEEAPSSVAGFVLDAGPGPDELAVGELIESPQGLKKRIYYRHQFRNAGECEAFRGWLLANNPEGNGSAMLHLALNEGTAALGQTMDKIAAEEAAKLQQTA